MNIKNIADLRLFVEVARTRSITRAAQVINVTPANASGMLKRLERQLGVRLVERSTRSLRLSAHGEVLIDHAARALELLDAAEAQLEADHREIAGTIRVGAPSDLARSVLLPIIDSFIAKHPRARLQLGVSDRINDVLREPVDLALRYGAVEEPNAIARQIAIVRRVPCASPSYLQRRGVPQSPRDLADHNCLIFLLKRGWYREWRFERDGQWEQVCVDGDRCADDAGIAHQWALAGAGIVCKAELDLTADLASGRLIRLLPDWQGEHYPLQAVLPSNRHLPHRVRSFIDFLASRIAALQNSGVRAPPSRDGG